jgi:transcriptional regulator with XRE-family HTH domain
MSKVLVGKCLLHKLLKRSYMTQTDLSVKTGISISQLSAYINNKQTMSLPTALLIAWALDCNVKELYDWKVK